MPYVTGTNLETTKNIDPFEETLTHMIFLSFKDLNCNQLFRLLVKQTFLDTHEDNHLESSEGKIQINSPEHLPLQRPRRTYATVHWTRME